MRLAMCSGMICERLIQTEVFQNASAVYVYMDCKGEVSTKPLLEAAWRMGKRTAAPLVLGPGRMEYYYIESMEDVAPGYYDIPEPTTGRQAKEEQPLLIVPGVAFDRKLHRCGYGGGFYDRYLAAHPEYPTIAVAFEFQLVDQVPSGEFDIRPQMLITEREILTLRST